MERFARAQMEENPPGELEVARQVDIQESLPKSSQYPEGQQRHHHQQQRQRQQELPLQSNGEAPQKVEHALPPFVMCDFETELFVKATQLCIPRPACRKPFEYQSHASNAHQQVCEKHPQRQKAIVVHGDVASVTSEDWVQWIRDESDPDSLRGNQLFANDADFARAGAWYLDKVVVTAFDETDTDVMFEILFVENDDATNNDSRRSAGLNSSHSTNRQRRFPPSVQCGTFMEGSGEGWCNGCSANKVCCMVGYGSTGSGCAACVPSEDKYSLGNALFYEANGGTSYLYRDTADFTLDPSAYACQAQPNTCASGTPQTTYYAVAGDGKYSTTQILNDRCDDVTTCLTDNVQLLTTAATIDTDAVCGADILFCDNFQASGFAGDNTNPGLTYWSDYDADVAAVRFSFPFQQVDLF